MRTTPRHSLTALLGTLAAGAVLVTGCSSSSAPSGAASPSAPAATSASAPVQGPGLSASPSGPAKPDSPQLVDVETFSAVVAEPGVTVVDVRTPEEYAAGHLDGAVNINVESPDFATRIADLDPAGTYAVYCRTANRSKTAVAQMAEAGVTGTYELDGGIVAWEAAGKPIVT